MTLLAIDRLRLTSGARVLVDELTLDLKAGEVLGLVGASGAGKSLTALAIMNLLPPRLEVSGDIVWRDTPLRARTEGEIRRLRGREIGMIFQEPMTALNPLLRVGDQIAETVRVHERAPRDVQDRVRHALSRVGLPSDAEFLMRHPHELSGGQRQRVAIAAATVLTPALLIADEPTTALDVTAQAQVLAALRELVRTTGMSLLLVTHDLGIVAALTDRVAAMQSGRLVEQARTTGSLRTLATPYARALLAAARLTPKRTAVAPATAAPAPSMPPKPPAPAMRSKPPAPAMPPTPPAGDRANAVPLLEVRDVVREYPGPRSGLWGRTLPRRAVDGVSLNVFRGETVGLIGESGAGKSSLLRVILALDRPQAGQVRLLGENFTQARGAPLRRLRRSLQIVFQDPYGSFDPEWSVERSVAEPLALWDAPLESRERSRRVGAVLERVGLGPDFAARHPHELSGGQRQRVAIARALICEPAVIVFDEAVSALDVLVRAQILDLLADLSAELAAGFLFVSHDLHVVRAIADRVYVMRRGRIVEEGPTSQVFAAPSNEYTAELIAATPTLGDL
jgi:peptide/nickel transport system ATP-binding protein